MPTPNQGRMPTLYVSHGGGPWPWLPDHRLGPFDHATLHTALRRLPEEVGVVPRAIVVVSGHWEAPRFTVQTNPHPPMLYDYGGFPRHTYSVRYPAPGSPVTAARIVELLTAAGIPVGEDGQRGFDHGAFVPLAVAWPAADVPVVQLSMKHGYDPEEHLALGRALTPLRDEGVLILGSGASNHNMRPGPRSLELSLEFDRWLKEVLVDASPEERAAALQRWDRAPGARDAQPYEDHLIPLMVAVGAAGDDPGTRIYHEPDFGGVAAQSSFRFGAPVASLVEAG